MEIIVSTHNLLFFFYTHSHTGLTFFFYTHTEVFLSIPLYNSPSILLTLSFLSNFTHNHCVQSCLLYILESKFQSCTFNSTSFHCGPLSNSNPMYARTCPETKNQKLKRVNHPPPASSSSQSNLMDAFHLKCLYTFLVFPLHSHCYNLHPTFNCLSYHIIEKAEHKPPY